MYISPVLDLLGEVSGAIGRDKVDLLMRLFPEELVNNGSYLVINRKQNYASMVEKRIIDEIFNVFQIPIEYKSILVHISW